MVVSRRVSRNRSTRENASGNGCRHCGSNYWERLPACPYCGTTNRQQSSDPLESSSTGFVDPRNSMKLCGTSFYYIFLALSLFIGAIIVFHDVVENIMVNVSPDIQKFQENTRQVAWVAIFIQQIMFCYWLMVNYNALATLHIRKRFPGLLAWTNFIPYLNFYFPQTMVQELEDRLYYVKVPNLNIRFVPVWWFFQSIAYFYLCTPFFSFWTDYFWTTIVAECIWGIAFICQGIMLFNFGNAIYTVGGTRHRSYGSDRSSDSADARRRHRR